MGEAAGPGLELIGFFEGFGKGCREGACAWTVGIAEIRAGLCYEIGAGSEAGGRTPEVLEPEGAEGAVKQGRCE